MESYGQSKNIQQEFICYCARVSEQDIHNAILGGADTVEKIIQATGAMANSNCKENNPNGTCCYKDIVAVFEQCQNED